MCCTSFYIHLDDQNRAFLTYYIKVEREREREREREQVGKGRVIEKKEVYWKRYHLNLREILIRD